MPTKHSGRILRFFLGVMAVALIVGCVSPQQAQANREARLANQFPNPADRVGLHIVFAGNDDFSVIYVPSRVSRDAVVQRMDQLCQKAAFGQQAVITEVSPFAGGTEEFADGSVERLDTLTIGCVG